MLITSYNPQVLGDVLVAITAQDTPEQKQQRSGDVVVITDAKSGQLLGVNFFNASHLLPELKGQNGQVKLDTAEVAKLNGALKTAGFDQQLTADTSSHFIVGQVTKMTDAPKSSHLKICQVDLGHGNHTQIVCGSPNVAEGIKAIVAMPGAMMPDGKIIWPGELVGVPSNGMLCGFRELHLKNAPDRRGLFIIPDDWQEVGEPVDFDRANSYFPAK